MLRENQPISERKETEPHITFQRPIGVDLFYAGDGSENNLPQSVLEHPRLLKEAAERRELYDSLGTLFAAIPDPRMDISEAMNTGLVSADSARAVYSQLTNFLETDENNARLILYLPSQILPDRRVKKDSEELEESEQKFAEKYKDAWVRLLCETDVRANFVDGDVLEPGMGEPKWVVKAGHVIPFALRKGLLRSEDILEVLRLSNDDELAEAVTEGTRVAYANGDVKEEDWKFVGILGRNNQVIDTVLHSSIASKYELQAHSISDVTSQFNETMRTIEETYDPITSSYAKSMSEARVRWEKDVRINDVIDKTAQDIASCMMNADGGLDTLLALESLFAGKDVNRLAVRTILKLGEDYARIDKGQGVAFADAAWDTLVSFFAEGDSEIKEEVSRCINYFVREGMLEQEKGEVLGIPIPDLQQVFPVDLTTLESNQASLLSVAATKLTDTPALSHTFYPGFLLCGSQMKGYAGLTSDLDTVVFVRPEVKAEDRHKVITPLYELPEIKNLGLVKEFWLDKKDGQLVFRQPIESKDRIPVISFTEIHSFLGGAWIGDLAKLQQVRDDLLVRYVDLSRSGDQKDDVRRHLLRQLENDLLQSRLLHKGYARFYPDNNEKIQEGELIDHQGSFYDPGYRRVATQTFVSRVFLPDLDLGVK